MCSHKFVHKKSYKVFVEIKQYRYKHYNHSVNIQKLLIWFYDLIYQKVCSMLLHNKMFF